MPRTAKSQISFADWELLQQGLTLEPLLQAISDFLDDQKEMIEAVRRDLQRGLKKPRTGRNGLTPAQVLRAFILMRVKNWHYRELRERIADGYTLRQFTTFYCQAVPKHHAFHRAFIRLTPKTLKAVKKAVQQRVRGFSDRKRVARRRMQEIQRMTAKERQERQTRKYRELIGVTEEVVNRARKVVEQTSKARGQGLVAEIAIHELRKEIIHYCRLGDQVINQARRRVLEGEQVPNAEKIYSIFEPHTDLIKRGKVQTPVEFGHKVFLAESAQGLITQYEVLEGNPNDEQHVEPSLKRHKESFGHAPQLYGSDRGFFSEQNVKSCKQNGVKVVCIPQCGGKKTAKREAYEKSSDFKKGQRFRAGIEGRISVLFRGRGMKRCLAEGRERFELWVGAAVLANNLMRIAALLSERTSRQRKAA